MSVVGVNLLWLVPGVVGGSEEYTIRLLRAVHDQDPDGIVLRLYARPDLLEAHPDLGQRFEVVTARHREPGRSLGVGATSGSKAERVALESTWLAMVSRHDTVVHHPGGVIPLVRSRPAVLTIHDLQPLVWPHRFSLLKRRWLGAMIPYSARAARVVLCPSKFTAEAIVTHLGVDGDRVEVVHHPHDPVPPGVTDPARDHELRSRFGTYLLLPGIAYDHKRHRDLVAALDRLRHRFPDLAVVLTGGPGPASPALAAQIARLDLGPRVHVLGRVSEDELDALYRSAVAMVFPSSYEGFGNPVLEAMARGCPVVTTDATALPEVAGEAALAVPVGRPGALAAAVARILDEPGLADGLRRAGPERARSFCSGVAGQRLVDCYRRAVQ